MQFERDKIEVKVEGVYRAEMSSDTEKENYLITKPQTELVFTPEGIVGDRHFGYLVNSGARDNNLYVPGTKKRNNRMWSAVSQKELQEIKKRAEIEGLTPEMMGFNILLSGVDNLSELSSLHYFVFSPDNDFRKRDRANDVILVNYTSIVPCDVVQKCIASELDDPSLGKRFSRSALGYRGTAGWVEKGGILKPGYNGWILGSKGRE